MSDSKPHLSLSPEQIAEAHDLAVKWAVLNGPDWATINSTTRLARAYVSLEEQYQAALDVLREADRLASIAHDAIWDKSVASNVLLHDNDDIRSAQWAIWKLHEIVRPLIVTPQNLEAQIAEKRNDKAFQDRLAHTIEETKDILDRLAEGASSPARSLDDIDPKDLGDGMEATVEPGDEMTEADIEAHVPASSPLSHGRPESTLPSEDTN